MILVLGLVVAAVVYFRAGAVDGGGNYQIVGGQAYAVEPSTSQRAQTERMGGKALVMTAQFDDWFGSLWHGQRLAWTLAVLAAIAAGGCVYVAGLMEEDAGSET